MYRGINGTPPSRAPSCTNPTSRNHHRPPPLPRPSHSARSLLSLFLSLSLSHSLSFSLCLVLSLYSFLLVFLRSPPLPRLPRIPCHLSNSIPLCLSIICTRACISARLSVSRPSPLAHPSARRLTTLTPLRPPSYSPAQHTSQIGSRATLYPVPVCTAAG